VIACNDYVALVHPDIDRVSLSCPALPSLLLFLFFFLLMLMLMGGFVICF
jgi:hypothetical protein